MLQGYHTGCQGGSGAHSTVFGCESNQQPWPSVQCRIMGDSSMAKGSSTHLHTPHPTLTSFILPQGLTVPQRTRSPLTPMGYLGTLGLCFFSHFFHILAGISVCISSTVQAQTMPQLQVGEAHRARFLSAFKVCHCWLHAVKIPGCQGSLIVPMNKMGFLAACKNQVDEVKQHTAASAPVCICLHQGILHQDIFSYMKVTDPAGKTLFFEIPLLLSSQFSNQLETALSVFLAAISD